jgi:hypothetical protein
MKAHHQKAINNLVQWLKDDNKFKAILLGRKLYFQELMN